MSRRTFLGSVVAAPLASRLGVGAAADEPRDETAPAAERVRERARQQVVVVGAGAFGGWSALSLLRAGHRVTLVDAWGAGHSRASSGGETRVIRGVYGGVADYTTMAARAMTLWRAAERAWGRRVLYRTGALWMCESDDSYVRRSIAPMKASGLPLEQIALDDAARRWPQVSFAGVRTVWLEPEAGYLTARAACELVRETFVREGGTYVQRWARPGAESGGRLSRLTMSDGSSLAADVFVFACGPWMAQVFPEVVGRRIVPTRQEVFFYGPPAGDTRFEGAALPTWVHMGERLFYGIPVHDRRGLKVADDTAGAEVDPTAQERVPTPAAMERARATLAARFPAMADAPLVESRVCQYEASTDGNYLVDRHPGLANVWLVGGGSGHGFKMGPAMGEHVAALVGGKGAVNPLFSYARLKPGS